MAGRQNIVSARWRQTATGIERYEEVCAENADDLKRKSCQNRMTSKNVGLSNICYTIKHEII